MGTEPSVTVATVAYNAAPFLEECVRGVQAQTFTDYEHLIVDDGSTDGTLELARKLARGDSRIRVEANPANLGLAGARTRAVALSRGEFLAWQDADDIAMPARLEQQHALLAADDGIAIVGGYLEFFDDSGPLSVRFYPTEDEQLRRMLFRFVPVSQPASMVRLSVLRACGAYDVRYPPAEDLDMLFRIAARGRMTNVPEVVVRYRQVTTSATFTKLRVMEKKTLAVRRQYLRGPVRPSVGDLLFNLAHAASLYLLPQRVKLALVQRIRNRPV
jgi:glycosyltransferase involved in cell wall biosynthesis